MPSDSAHAVAARKNARTIQHLRLRADHFPGWLTTVAFYEAIHIVEATFFLDPKCRVSHTKTHEERIQFLRTENRYQKIYKHFRPLWNDSQLARYLEVKVTNQSLPGGLFETYMTGEHVIRTHVNHNLRQIIKSARKLLGDPTFLEDIEGLHEPE